MKAADAKLPVVAPRWPRTRSSRSATASTSRPSTASRGDPAGRLDARRRGDRRGRRARHRDGVHRHAPLPALSARRAACMKVLIVGGGGREHALAWKCAQSRAWTVLVAPGNAGTAREPKVRNVDVAADDVAALVSLAQEQRVDLTIVGPRGAAGARRRRRVRGAGLRCFGPRRARRASRARRRSPRNSSAGTASPRPATRPSPATPSTRRSSVASARPSSSRRRPRRRQGRGHRRQRRRGDRLRAGMFAGSFGEAPAPRSSSRSSCPARKRASS
jgi:hypothetical protein